MPVVRRTIVIELQVEADDDEQIKAAVAEMRGLGEHVGQEQDGVLLRKVTVDVR